MKKDVIVVGGGDFAKEVIWLAQCSGSWNVRGVLTDKLELQGKALWGVPILGTSVDWFKTPECGYVVAVGSPRQRREIVERMCAIGAPSFIKLIHPNVTLAPDVQVGLGTIICEGALLTVSISIGEHCLINLGATIGHDVIIGDYCTLSPQTALSGHVRLEDGVEMGTGALVIPGVHVGQGSMAGAGTVVNKDIGSNVVAVGIPARTVGKLEPF